MDYINESRELITAAINLTDVNEKNKLLQAALVMLDEGKRAEHQRVLAECELRG